MGYDVRVMNLPDLLFCDRRSKKSFVTGGPHGIINMLQ